MESIDPHEIVEEVLDVVEQIDSRIGTLGWLAIAGGVLAFDLIADETLTHAYRRGIENPRTRPAVLAGTGYVVAHLTGILPRRLDAFYLFREE